MRPRKLVIVIFMSALVFIGMTPAFAQKNQPTPEAPSNAVVTRPNFSEGDLLLHETFNSTGAWEHYTGKNGSDFGVDGGVYAVHIPKTAPDTYVWAVNNTEHTDVIIDATVIQRRVNEDSRVGLMCRTDIEGFGYYFIIGGNGVAYIGKGVEEEVTRLTPLQTFDAVNRGTDANLVEVVCAGNYLALSVNNTLVAEVNDDTFTTGFTGITASSGANVDTDITVDDLDIHEAIVSSSAEIPQLENVAVGKLLLSETFNSVDAWELYNSQDDLSHFGVTDGIYLASTSKQGVYVRGQNTLEVADSVVTVEATAQSGPENNGFGLMCRATPENDGNGYYLLISGDGYYSIQRIDANVDKAIPLIDWTESPEIITGNVTNTVTAVCVGDYLALYANGTLLGEIHDSTYTSGVTGLIASTFDEGQIDVAFDNLTIYEAKLK